MANIITGIRIACAWALIFCPTFSSWFYALHVLGGVSDILDGIVARHLGKVTRFGAQLDTAADIALVVVVTTKVVRAVFLPGWLIVWMTCIAVIKSFNMISGFVIHRRFVSEHTVANKICGVLLFAVPLCITRFPWQSVEIIIVLLCSWATFAAVQEGYFIFSGREIE